jgi:hypothetical protein
MAKVTLVLASGPGFPNGDPECRYEIEVTLDSTGRLDRAAWYADPNPWPAKRHWRDEWPRDGDVQLDEETGAWSLRFFPKPGEAGEAPPHELLMRSNVPMRPGEYLSIREPDGKEFAFRIVSTA